MKTKFIYLVCSVIAILISGCSSIEISDNYDPTYDFSKLKTYNWYSAHEYEQALIVKQIQHELKAQLAAKGFQHQVENPDFDIAVYGGTDDKIEIHSGNLGYGYGGWYGRGGIDVYHYKEGTLILDFVDLKTGQLIFQSTAVVEVEQNISM